MGTVCLKNVIFFPLLTYQCKGGGTWPDPGFLPVGFSSCWGSHAAVYTQRGLGLDHAYRTLLFWGQNGGCLISNPHLLLSKEPNPSAIPSEGRLLHCSREGLPSTVTSFLRVQCYLSTHCKAVLPGQHQQLL